MLTDTSLDKSFVSAAMSVPSQSELVEMLEVANPDNVHEVSALNSHQGDNWGLNRWDIPKRFDILSQRFSRRRRAGRRQGGARGEFTLNSP